MSSSVYTIVVLYSYYTNNILTHSLLCTEMEYVILCIEKKTLSPCIENTRSPLYRQGNCNTFLTYQYYTDTLSPLYIDRALPSTILHTLHSLCREHNLSSVQRRSRSSSMYTIVVMCSYSTSTILTHLSSVYRRGHSLPCVSVILCVYYSCNVFLL